MRLINLTPHAVTIVVYFDDGATTVGLVRS